MPQEVQTHPSPELLAAFGLGRLEENESARIEAHLADCALCRTAVERLPDDTLLALVKAAGPARSEQAPNLSQAPTGSYGSAAQAAPAIPAELSGHPRYRLEGLLGVGGMGAVYRAEHQFMKRPVAVKVIGRTWVGDPERVERFAREVKAAARLAHPNIVAAYDAEQAGDSQLLVMEYVEGLTLAKLVAEQGPVPVARACDYARQAALGLQHAFEQGMVHRDITPHNLMLTPGGQVKILDFGLARFAMENAPASPSAATVTVAASESDSMDTPLGRLTKTGRVMGTPDYIAPEQARDAHAADIRADIYSLGCTLYFLLAGRPPFPDGSAVEKVKAHWERQPRPLTELRGDVAEPLARVVARMMAKDPAARYQTPAAAQALAPFAGEAPVTRSRRRLAIAGALLFLALGLAGYSFGPALFRDPEDKETRRQGDKETRRQETEEQSSGPSRVPVQPAKAPSKAPGEVRRFVGHTAGVWSVALSADGSRALTGSSDKTVRLWNVATGKELQRCTGHTDRVECVALSADGRRALSGSADKTLRLWNLDTGQEVCRFQADEFVVMSVAFSPDQRRAISGGMSSSLRLWDLEAHKELRSFRGHNGWVYRVACTPDGRHILSAGPDHTIRLWDVESGQEVRRFGEERTAVWSLALSADGRCLVTGNGGVWGKSGEWLKGRDNSVRRWDVNSGKELGRWTGHSDGIMSLAFSRDGRRAVSAGADNTVRLWDVASGKQLHCFSGHTDRVMSVAFSPDGRHVLSGSWDHTVRLWEFDLKETTMSTPHALGDAWARWPALVMLRGLLAAGFLFGTEPAKAGDTASAERPLMGHPFPAGTYILGCSAEPLTCKNATRIDAPFTLHPNQYILSGGPNPTDQIIVDDDLEVWRGKKKLFIDDDHIASTDNRFGADAMYSGCPIILVLEPKSKFRLRAIDHAPTDAILGDIWLHRYDGAKKQLVKNRKEQSNAQLPHVFFEEEFDCTFLEAAARPAARKLTERQLDALWADLASSDAGKGYLALWTAAGIPEQMVPFLKERLRPAAALNAEQQKRIVQWIADLDNDASEVRERASVELAKVVEQAEPLLRKALEEKSSLEARRRIEGLLEKIRGVVPGGDQARFVRAVAALEHCDTVEARQLLQTLAKGETTSRLTAEAKAALERQAERATGP